MIFTDTIFRGVIAKTALCLPLILLLPGGRPAQAAGPANPNASDDAKKILNYITSLSDKADGKVISGQFAGWGNDLPNQYQKDVTALNSGTGKWVALIGTDWHDFNSGSGFKPNELINWWKAGGLVTVDYHFDNPIQGGDAWTTGGNLSELLNTSSSAYKKWQITLDNTAANLKTLQDAGVVVLWRPFHEQNGSWFWWGGKNQADFVALWKQMFTYFTKTKGLNNLLWVFAPNYGSNVTKYYPGAEYVDIVGMDAYFDRPKTFDLSGYKEMIALGKPFGITEFGGVPAAGGSNHVFDNTVLINEIKAKYPKTSFFMNWHCPWSIYCQDNAAGLLNDSWVITRDELAWKNAPIVSIYRPVAPRNSRLEKGAKREGYSVLGRETDWGATLHFRK
jgi:mannan endo-1,4-beta-mannosidase